MTPMSLESSGIDSLEAVQSADSSPAAEHPAHSATWRESSVRTEGGGGGRRERRGGREGEGWEGWGGGGRVGGRGKGGRGGRGGVGGRERGRGRGGREGRGRGEGERGTGGRCSSLDGGVPGLAPQLPAGWGAVGRESQHLQAHQHPLHRFCPGKHNHREKRS